MGVVQAIIPYEFSPVGNCIIFGLVFTGDINLIAGTQASFSVDFISGGTAADGTIIIIQGQRFEINNSATSIDGYHIRFDGLTDEQRATWLLGTLNATLFFDPEKAYVFQTSSTGANVLYNQVGQQGNWQFDNGGISEISFILSNGTDRVDLSNMAYVWSMYEDRSSLSLPPLKIIEDRILPLLPVYSYNTSPATVIVDAQLIDVSSELKNQVATVLPGTYDPIFVPINDQFFRKLFFMRSGLRYLNGCEVRNMYFSNGNSLWVYNSLFQDVKNTGLLLLEPYIYYGRL